MAKRVNVEESAGVEEGAGESPGSGGSRSGSGSPRRRRRGGPARRDALFGEALRLFRERGFHGTSINDIGAAVGVTGPALYRHFAGKAEVLAEAIREGSRRIAAASREAVADPSLSPDARLEALVRAYVDVALENADMHVAYILEARHLPEELLAPLRRSERRQRDEWRTLLQAARPELSDDEAGTLVAMAIFSVVSLCVVPSRMKRSELVELAAGRVMSLLGVEKTV